MDGGLQGIVWSLTIVVMPILLGLALAYGAWMTYQRRKHGAPRTGTGGIQHSPPRSDQRDARKIGTIAVGSVIAFAVLLAVLLLVLS